MKKITKPHEPDEEKHIFTEGIDYSKTDKTSIWGTGDKGTLELLKKTGIIGKWLNLAAGDGRYNSNLLEKADFVIASDIDENALAKLWQNTSDKCKEKLETKVFDVTKKIPFEGNSFDGVFCTGTLHLFPKEILRQIFSEIDRILKPSGRILIDFATDIKRILPNGKFYIIKSEPQYKLEEARKFIKELLKNCKVRIIELEVPAEEIKTRGFVYRFSCKGIIVIADKK